MITYTLYRPDNQYCVFVPTPRACFGANFDGLKHVAVITLLQTVAMTGPSDRALRRDMLTSKPKRLDNLTRGRTLLENTRLRLSY